MTVTLPRRLSNTTPSERPRRKCKKKTVAVRWKSELVIVLSPPSILLETILNQALPFVPAHLRSAVEALGA